MAWCCIVCHASLFICVGVSWLTCGLLKWTEGNIYVLCCERVPSPKGGFFPFEILEDLPCHTVPCGGHCRRVLPGPEVFSPRAPLSSLSHGARGPGARHAGAHTPFARLPSPLCVSYRFCQRARARFENIRRNPPSCERCDLAMLGDMLTARALTLSLRTHAHATALTALCPPNQMAAGTHHPDGLACEAHKGDLQLPAHFMALAACVDRRGRLCRLVRTPPTRTHTSDPNAPLRRDRRANLIHGLAT